MTIFTESQPKYTILDLGFNKALTKSLLGLQGETTPEMVNVFSGGTAPRTLIAGELITALEQQSGVVFSGKTAFDNTETGYRLGIDTDGTIKFYIGSSSSYLNWTGTTLSLSGGITASSIDIGGADATSFHVDVDGNMWLGAATFAASDAKISNAGAATLTSATVTGAITTGVGSTINGTYIDSLAVSKLATGTISSKQITLAIAAGTGDSYVAAGKTDFDNTVAGFILGLDDSDSDKAKFYIGDSSDYLNWDGATLTVQGAVTGSTITGSTITTGTVGANVNIELSRLSVRTGTTEVALIELGSNGGFFGLKDTSGNSIGKWQVRNAGADVSFIVDVGDLYIQSADDIIFVGTAGKDIYPASDNAMSLGLGSNRWSDLRSVLINGADYCFDNGVRITEEGNYGISFYNADDQKIMTLDKEGNLWLKGSIKSDTDMQKQFPFYRKGLIIKE